MPQLPSGRKVGVRPDVITNMIKSPFHHLNELGQIYLVEDLYPYLFIIEFIETNKNEANKVSFASCSKKIIEVGSHQPVKTKLSVSDIFNDISDWSVKDVRAFIQWVKSPDMASFYTGILDEVRNIRDKVRDNVDALAYADIDPNQDEQERFRRASVFVSAVTRNREVEH